MMSMSSFGVAMPRLLFFLKAMKYKHSLNKFHGVDRAVSTACLIFNHLQHTGTAKTFEHFGGIVSVARLRQRQSKAEIATDINRQRHQVFVAAAYLTKWLFLARHVVKYT